MKVWGPLRGGLGPPWPSQVQWLRPGPHPPAVVAPGGFSRLALLHGGGAGPRELHALALVPDLSRGTARGAKQQTGCRTGLREGEAGVCRLGPLEALTQAGVPLFLA